MLENGHLERVNAAVRDCLDLCYRSEDPFHCWSQYVETLRSDTTWNRHDVELVQQATRRILKALLMRESDELDVGEQAAWMDHAQGA